MKCPVCEKECAGKSGVSSHLFKAKDEKHKLFAEEQNSLVLKMKDIV